VNNTKVPKFSIVVEPLAGKRCRGEDLLNGFQHTTANSSDYTMAEEEDKDIL